MALFFDLPFGGWDRYPPHPDHARNGDILPTNTWLRDVFITGSISGLKAPERQIALASTSYCRATIETDGPGA
jgi:hypothetical protein